MFGELQASLAGGATVTGVTEKTHRLTHEFRNFTNYPVRIFARSTRLASLQAAAETIAGNHAGLGRARWTQSELVLNRVTSHWRVS